MARRQVDIPSKLFHVTLKDSIPSIMENGLIPSKSKGLSFEAEDNSRVGVYLTSDWKALIEIDADFELGKEYTVLSVDISDIKHLLISDTAYDFDECSEELFTAEELEEGWYDQFAWFYPGVIERSLISIVDYFTK